MKYDLIIIGAGPAGIFTALEMVRNGSKKKILMIEKGHSIEKRSCPKNKTKECINCKPYCNITTGFSGAGAFSDGKLSLSYEVGGDLPTLIGANYAQEMIDYTDKIYLDFGADTKVEGINQDEKVKQIRRNAIKSGLKLVDCPIRHLGTEQAQVLYAKIQKYLLDSGVEIRFGYVCQDLIIKDGKCEGVVISDALKKDNEERIMADSVVVATGRKGADWLSNICNKYDIKHRSGTVDIGVRVT